ncbi:hypothetical protein V6N11_044401 [Hibiscus sabdariffa]|uniref:Uncharacterized protein n=1 Tax=Hibiscus sabdariffa TaxID=183260 RepID=A0ABR2RFF7_9ROSI
MHVRSNAPARISAVLTIQLFPSISLFTIPLSKATLASIKLKIRGGFLSMPPPSVSLFPSSKLGLFTPNKPTHTSFRPNSAEFPIENSWRVCDYCKYWKLSNSEESWHRGSLLD